MTHSIIKDAIAAVLALSVTGATTVAIADDMSAPKGMEKCYGIAKKGKNDCGTATHGCGGEAKTDGDKKEWIAVPNGLCNKIVGGSIKSG